MHIIFFELSITVLAESFHGFSSHPARMYMYNIISTLGRLFQYSKPYTNIEFDKYCTVIKT